MKQTLPVEITIDLNDLDTFQKQQLLKILLDVHATYSLDAIAQDSRIQLLREQIAFTSR